MSLHGLNELPPFSELSAEALESLARGAVVRPYAPGELLWLAGAEPRGIFVVLEGEVRVVRSRKGRRHVIHRGTEGSTLGEVPYFAGGAYPATAEAVRRTRCLVLNRDAVDRALEAHPEVCRIFLRHLARRVRFLVDRLDERSGMGVRERLARRLLERSDRARDDRFTLGATQAELAEELGSVREVVVRTLRELREAGALASDGRGGYRVLDREALEKLAGA